MRTGAQSVQQSSTQPEFAGGVPVSALRAPSGCEAAAGIAAAGCAMPPQAPVHRLAAASPGVLATSTTSTAMSMAA